MVEVTELWEINVDLLVSTDDEADDELVDVDNGLVEVFIDEASVAVVVVADMSHV